MKGTGFPPPRPLIYGSGQQVPAWGPRPWLLVFLALQGVFRARYWSLKGYCLRVSSRHKSSNRRLCARRHVEPPLRGRLCCDGLTSNHTELLALIRRAGLQLADYSVRNADHFWARSSTPLDQNRIKISKFSSKIAKFASPGCDAYHRRATSHACKRGPNPGDWLSNPTGHFWRFRVLDVEHYRPGADILLELRSWVQEKITRLFWSKSSNFDQK